VAVTEHPILIVVAGASGDPLSELFGKRGFVTHVVGDAAALRTLENGGVRPSAAIVDFELPDADAALNLLFREVPRPVLIGVAGADEVILGEDLLDAAFRRPVDPARLFARMVNLLAAKKKGPGPKRNRLTGIVAVVRGNELFRLAENELRSAVPPVNAAAILEKALRDLGCDPLTLATGDLAAMLASGRLEKELASFGDPAAIREALGRIAVLLPR